MGRAHQQERRHYRLRRATSAADSSRPARRRAETRCCCSSMSTRRPNRVIMRRLHRTRHTTSTFSTCPVRRARRWARARCSSTYRKGRECNFLGISRAHDGPASVGPLFSYVSRTMRCFHSDTAFALALMNRLIRVTLASLLGCYCACIFAQASPDEVLAENELAKITRADYEADLLRIPPEKRDSFSSDPKRVGTELSSLLTNKTLAAEARKAGIDRDLKVQRLIALQVDAVLAQLEVRAIEEQAATGFEAKREQFLVKAREVYVRDKDKYRVPEQVNASHILFDTKKRGNEAALALAKDTLAKLRGGADFAATAREVSDDPTAKTNDGNVGWFGPGRMDPAFTEAAFQLKSAGDISDPVLSSFVYHLIRLDGRRPA